MEIIVAVLIAAFILSKTAIPMKVAKKAASKLEADEQRKMRYRHPKEYLTANDLIELEKIAPDMVKKLRNERTLLK